MNAAARHQDARLARVIAFYESLEPSALPRLAQLYSAQAHFQDPFNDVRGVEPIRRVFEHMYRTLDAPRFVVHSAVLEGDQAFLTWDFLFRLRRSGAHRVHTLQGASHLAFDGDGRVALHRDYWDAAGQLYEKLPAVGVLMRWLKRRASSD